MSVHDPDIHRTYIGYDERGLPFVMRYDDEREIPCWAAIGFEPDDGGAGFHVLGVLLVGDKANFIKRWEELP